MKTSGKTWQAALSIALILLSVFLTGMTNHLLPVTRGEGSGDYPPPAQGDWQIASDTLITDEDIEVSGNITVAPGASLTLDNSALTINASDYGSAVIRVKNGGELYVINNSAITEGESGVNYDFVFENGSRGLIANSTIEDCGWNDGGTYQSSGGILIVSDNVTIENSAIQNCYIGIMVYNSSPEIRYNTIKDNQKQGITIISSSPSITGNEIATTPVGVYAIYSEVTFIDNEVKDNGDGMVLYYSVIDITGGKITSNSREDCTTG
ncbi:MAG: right-handed parallel beta-helix repeat-containing protein, partial [Thermoplasmata archaeon]